MWAYDLITASESLADWMKIEERLVGRSKYSHIVSNSCSLLSGRDEDHIGTLYCIVKNCIVTSTTTIIES